MATTRQATRLNKILNKWLKTEILGQVTYLLSVIIVGLFGTAVLSSMPAFYTNHMINIAQQMVIWTSLVLLSIASLIIIFAALRRLITEGRSLYLEGKRTFRRSTQRSNNQKENIKKSQRRYVAKSPSQDSICYGKPCCNISLY